jgi:hypothetical protein
MQRATIETSSALGDNPYAATAQPWPVRGTTGTVEQPSGDRPQKTGDSMHVIFGSDRRTFGVLHAIAVWAALMAAPALTPVYAQDQQTPTAGNRTAAQSRISCSSASGDQQHCAANTSAGVALQKSTGPGACLLGKTWGYDDAGIWVSDGCGGEFVLGQTTPQIDPAALPAPGQSQPAERIESWGEFEPGDGFLVGRSDVGELSISAYGLLRYMNQLPADETFTDHLGREHPVNTRLDFFPHRALVFLKGWVGHPRLVYTIIFWTVNATDQDALFPVLGYQFTRKFSLYGGINGNTGTRSLQGSHPYWLGHDRVMADEFFRPYFTFGVWAQGEAVPGLWYSGMVGNNSSSLGITAAQLDRKATTGASLWWMPTTQEFGPRGAYGDWEMHERVATRFGISSTFSPEERFTDSATGGTGNTTIRLADSLNVFDAGALAPGVTVEQVDYRILSFDAGVKYRGFFLQTEIFTRWLDGFVADGPLPVSSIVDTGFYVQGAFFPVPKKLELYAATSQIYGDKDAGFDDSSEYLAGANFYPFDTRNHRLNVQVIDVNRSPVSSTFGYYTGGQDRTTVSVAFSVFF